MAEATIYLREDSIAALSTGSGRSAIAVIRLSGPKVLYTIQQIFQTNDLHALTTPRRLGYGRIVDPDTGDAIDKVLCAIFPSPHSYTGEDMAEIHCHGSEAVVRRILEVLCTKEFRLAEPGEFTFRAVRNGKLDLAQAEAVASLIDSRTQLARAISLRMLEGAFSKDLNQLRDLVTDILCEIETIIEFPEDAEDEKVGLHLARKNETIQAASMVILQRAVREQRFEQGILVVLAGRPNVGKSSLFNRLLGRDRAIVTPHPGTTRDSIEGTIDLGGHPVTLIDTAGLRETQEEIEAIGVQRSQELLSTSHIVLYVIEAGQEPSPADQEILARIMQTDNQARLILVSNKADLCQEERIAPAPHGGENLTHIFTSANSGGGIQDLLQCLETEVRNLVPAEAESSLLINARQEQGLHQIHTHIQTAGHLLFTLQPLELAAEEYRAALRGIAELDGTGITPDIMDTIFSKFCIGK